MVLPLLPLATALLPLVADLAPPVVRFLVGEKAGAEAEKVAGAASRVAEVVRRVTDAPVATPEDVAALRERLAADAALRERLRIALAEANIELERLALERERAYLADTRSARETAVARLKAGGGDARANVMLISAFVAVVAIVALLILHGDIPPEVVGFVIGIGGMFARNIGSAFDFEFGSSRGSREKDSQLQDRLNDVAAPRERAAAPAPPRADRVRALLAAS